MTKLFSHTSYAIHTNHHHTYEQPKQYYSMQLSHTFNKANIILPCTKIIIAKTYKKNSVIACTKQTFPAIYHYTPTEPRLLQVTPVAVACGTTSPFFQGSVEVSPG
jgi:hypothetical protein